MCLRRFRDIDRTTCSGPSVVPNVQIPQSTRRQFSYSSAWFKRLSFRTTLRLDQLIDALKSPEADKAPRETLSPHRRV